MDRFFDYTSDDKIQTYCHLDDRRDLFVKRDFSSRQLAGRNDNSDVAFCHRHIVPKNNEWTLRMKATKTFELTFYTSFLTSAL